MIRTPALEWHDGVRVAAIGVGAVLLLVIALARLAELRPVWSMSSSLVPVARSSARSGCCGRCSLTLGNYNLIVFFVGIVAVCVVLGVPIAFAFGIATLAYLLTTDTPLTIVVSRMDEGMSHLILLSVPLFVFLGVLIEMTGMARAMVDFLAALLGHVRGGLSYVLLGAMYLVSGISGLEGRRHGGGRAGAVPGDEEARRARRATWSRCSRRRARCPRRSRRASS